MIYYFEILFRQLNALGINHTTDICGTITVQTKQGKVIYYPTKNKIQYKGTVTAGGLNNVKNLVESLGLSGEIPYAPTISRNEIMHWNVIGLATALYSAIHPIPRLRRG
ncbi:hypothetical protein XBKB1_2340001 [Xenorhabdus bovienii str. kraussei Becker Underwood]|uniref:Uncharacterized protein n=1 Tax=Xenorhabdus bovienii str. kraussei Becker Underwood TaxID=1398204 RepID=A0A077PVW5_XENBV|nr:hypothetical protein XBKB1_2340001 [Xenorhabdus bovienii str. kraussei Becker Underwood]